MPGVNTYKDTEAADYLDAIRKHQAENRNANSGAANFSPTYVLQRSNQINVSNSFTNTAQTLGDYDVTDNTAYLVAYLPFQLDSLDASNSNHGTWTGSETYTTGPEISATKYPKAASFNGSSYVTLANESNFDFEHSDPFSVSFWVYVGSSITNQDVLFGKGNDLDAGPSVAGYGLVYATTTSNLSFRLTDGTTVFAVVSSVSSVPLNTWTHTVCTFSGNSNRSGMKIYINGSISVTGTPSATITSTIQNNVSFTIGAESDGGRIFDGYIAEVQVWNSELDSDDVTDLYNGKQLNKDTAATNPAIIGYSDVT